jgi:hypothetical protein
MMAPSITTLAIMTFYVMTLGQLTQHEVKKLSIVTSRNIYNHLRIIMLKIFYGHLMIILWSP